MVCRQSHIIPAARYVRIIWYKRVGYDLRRRRVPISSWHIKYIFVLNYLKI